MTTILIRQILFTKLIIRTSELSRQNWPLHSSQFSVLNKLEAKRSKVSVYSLCCGNILRKSYPVTRVCYNRTLSTCTRLKSPPQKIDMETGFEKDLVEALRDVVKGSNWQYLGEVEQLKKVKCRR